MWETDNQMSAVQDNSTWFSTPPPPHKNKKKNKKKPMYQEWWNYCDQSQSVHYIFMHNSYQRGMISGLLISSYSVAECLKHEKMATDQLPHTKKSCKVYLWFDLSSSVNCNKITQWHDRPLNFGNRNVWLTNSIHIIIM